MTYRTTRQADEDIVGLYLRGLQAFGEAATERYVDGLFSVFALLAENPHLAWERRELKPPMRLHPYGSHPIVYALADEEVLIVRVLHGHQDWQSLLS